MPRPNKRKEVLKEFYQTQHPDISAGEIANNTEITRKTAKKHIERLEAEDKIVHTRNIGRVKLYTLKIRGKIPFNNPFGSIKND